MDRMLHGNKTLADDDYLLTFFDDIIIKKIQIVPVRD